MNIMISPRVVECDWLTMCGYMTFEQSQQYMDITGDYSLSRQELNILAVDIANYARPQLEQLILNDVAGKRNAGIANLFERLHDMLYYRFEPIKEIQSYGHSLGLNFILQVTSLIGMDIICMSNDKQRSTAVRNGASIFLERAMSIFQQNFGIDFMGVQFYNEMFAYKETLNDVALNLLGVAIGVPLKWNDDDYLIMKKKNRSLLDRVRQESSYKHITLVTLSESYPQIIVIGRCPVAEKKSSAFCVVRINFNSEKVGYPHFRIDKHGFDYVDYGILSGIINVSINQETGDLCFITSGQPLSLIIPEHYYMTLQSFVFKGLLRYLQEKESDVEDLFIYSRDELYVQQVAQEASRENSHDDSSLQDEIVVERMPEYESWWKQYMHSERYGIEVDAVTETESHKEQSVALPKHLRKQIMDCISGASSTEIFAALRRMLGSEERVRGSHTFFRSPRNGVILPIPRSSGISVHSISPRIITSNLTSWGYSPMEFAQELGMEVFERNKVFVCKHEESCGDTILMSCL